MAVGEPLTDLCVALRGQGGLAEFFFVQEWLRHWPRPIASGPLWQLHDTLDQVNEASFESINDWQLSYWVIGRMDRAQIRSRWRQRPKEYL